MGLDLLERGAESQSRSPSATAGRTPSNTRRQSRSVILSLTGGRSAKARTSSGPCSPCWPGGWTMRTDQSPGKVEARDERRNDSVVLSPAVDDEAPTLESVQADTRTAASTGESGQQPDRGHREAGELEDGSRDRQADLRADSQPHVFGGRVYDADRHRLNGDTRSAQLIAQASRGSFAPDRPSVPRRRPTVPARL